MSKDGEYAGNIHVLHENTKGEYRMTVSNPETGALLFSWSMPAEAAVAMAHQIADTISETVSE